jgi:hypothetical protein
MDVSPILYTSRLGRKDNSAYGSFLCRDKTTGRDDEAQREGGIT